MGILDKKTRFIDLVITQEGKRQIASGRLRAELASLSDGGTFYDPAERNDVANRIYFEAMERPENSIVLEKDDSGNLLPFDFSPTGSIVGNNVFLGEVNESNMLRMKAVTGSQFASTESEIMDSMLRHFKNNYLLGTHDQIGSDDFVVSPREVIYEINDQVPFGGNPRKEVINVDFAEPFFLDPRLTHLPNFQFLPPVNKSGSQFGIYEDLRPTTEETWDDIKNRLNYADYKEVNHDVSSENLKENYFGNLQNISRKLLLDSGELPGRPPQNTSVKEFQIDKTSFENNLLIQMFEDSPGSTMTKLDIIDAGVFTDDSDKTFPNKRVFYLGKVYFDSFQTPTFINMFTLVME
jgi:hypothetical protein